MTKEEERKLLLRIANGFFKAGNALLILVVVVFVACYFKMSDDQWRELWSPSYLRAEVLTDKQTGCRYLYSKKVGITPQLDASGKPICAVTP